MTISRGNATEVWPFGTSRHRVSVDSDMLKELGDLEARWLLTSVQHPASAVLSLSEQIADTVAFRIIRGEYTPGERLVEIALAEEFQVSRGPIREALRILESEGLVVIQPRRGARVQRLSRENVQNIFEVRSNLMGLLAAKIAEDPPQRSIEFCQAIANLLNKAHQDGKLDDFIDLIYRASMYICDAGDNELARSVLASLSRQTLAYTRKALVDPDKQQTWLCHWSEFLVGMRKHDPTAARAAMQELIDEVGAAVVKVVDMDAKHTFSSKKDQKQYVHADISSPPVLPEGSREAMRRKK